MAGFLHGGDIEVQLFQASSESHENSLKLHVFYIPRRLHSFCAQKWVRTWICPKIWTDPVFDSLKVAYLRGNEHDLKVVG